MNKPTISEASKYILEAVVTVKEAALLYDVSVKAVQNWIDSGKIHARQSASRANTLISVSSLEAFRGAPVRWLDLWGE